MRALLDVNVLMALLDEGVPISAVKGAKDKHLVVVA